MTVEMETRCQLLFGYITTGRKAAQSAALDSAAANGQKIIIKKLTRLVI